MKTTKKFSIRHFDDYHEIVPAKGGKAIELGCFPPDRGYYYCRYFGLFYKGRKPTVKQVLDRLYPKIHLGDFFVGNYNCGISPAALREQITCALRGSAGKGH